LKKIPIVLAAAVGWPRTAGFLKHQAEWQNSPTRIWPIIVGLFARKKAKKNTGLFPAVTALE